MKTYEITANLHDGRVVVKEIKAIDVLIAVKDAVVPIGLFMVKSITVTELKP